MQPTQKINFREIRDFGDIINTTFSFLRQNFLSMFKSILVVCGPPLFFGGILFASFFTSAFANLESGTSAANFIGLGLGYIFIIAAALLLSPMVYSYIAMYLERPDANFSIGEIWRNGTKYILPFFGAGIIVGMLVFAGTIFFLIPGVYLGITLSFIFIVMTVEQKGVFDGIGRCFELIKGNWWSTLGLLFVVMIIQVSITYAAMIPIYLIGMLIGLSSIDATSLTDQTAGISLMMSIATPFTYLISLGAQLIVLTAISLKYFSIVEQKEGVGMMGRIETFNLESGSQVDSSEKP